MNVLDNIARFKPILGSGIKRDMNIDEFFGHVLYPVIATPKFDGIRCVTHPKIIREGDCSPLCRSLDPVPNGYIFEKISKECPHGLDGELMTYESQGDLLVPDDGKPRKFYQIQSDIMSFGGIPNFKYHVFDFIDFSARDPHMIPYYKRLEQLKALMLPAFCIHVPQRLCGNREELEKFESEMVEAGYEGICWRHVNSKYKYGRSTLREQVLIKMKRFQDAEATIIETYEEMGNNNPQSLNALGYAERSSHSANMLGKNRLGGFICKCDLFEETFKVGSGFNASQRENYWTHRDKLVGEKITFKFQIHGGKDRPRIPIFKAIRDERDWSTG